MFKAGGSWDKWTKISRPYPDPWSGSIHDSFNWLFQTFKPSNFLYVALISPASHFLSTPWNVKNIKLCHKLREFLREFLAVFWTASLWLFWVHCPATHSSKSWQEQFTRNLDAWAPQTSSFTRDSFLLDSYPATFPPDGGPRNLAVDKKQLRVYNWQCPCQLFCQTCIRLRCNKCCTCTGLWDRIEGSFFESLASFYPLNQSWLNSSSDVVMISQECVTCKSLYTVHLYQYIEIHLTCIFIPKEVSGSRFANVYHEFHWPWKTLWQWKLYEKCCYCLWLCLCTWFCSPRLSRLPQTVIYYNIYYIYIYTVSDSMSARIPATPKHVGAGLFQKDGNTCWMAETLSNMPWQRSQLWICTAFYFVLLHNISSTCQRNRSRNRESTLMQLSHPATAKNCWVLELDRRYLYKFQIYSRFTNKLVKRLQDTILRAYCVPCTTKLAGPDL